MEDQVVEEKATKGTNGHGNEDIEEVPIFRKKRVVIPLILLVLVIIGSAGYWYVGLRAYISTDDAYVDANRLSISAKMLGRVQQLAADEGDTVRKGEVLVRFDDSDLQAQKAQAQASLMLARASIGLATSNLDKAKEDFQRTSVQYKGGAVPKEQFDHSSKALSATQAEYQIALARIQTAQAQLGVVQASLDNFVIASPIDGIVAKRWILPGDVVQAGQPIFLGL